MADKPNEIAKAESEKNKVDPQSTGVAKVALEELGSKVQVIADVTTEIGNLYKDFNTLSWEQTFDRFKGMFAIAFIGMLSSKEGYETWKEERKKERGNKNMDHSVKVIDGNRGNHEKDGNISQKQRFVNMKSIRYFDLETREPFKKHDDGFAKILKEKNVRPSKFIMENSSALFKEGITSFSEFKKTAEDRLVDESITDPKERERQAAIILSCCAVGRFQILPYYHFAKLGLTTEGAEGLKNMYDFICSTEIQIVLYEKITDELWAKYKDPGIVAVDYYSGKGAEYKANPNDPKFHKVQYGKHGSVHSYAQTARRLYAENKRNYPHATDIDCLVMALEKIESSGTIMRDRFLGKIAYGEKKSEPPSVKKLAKNDILKPEVKSEVHGGNEAIQDKGIDAHMHQFIEEELKNKEGAKLWAENLEGNGNRTVLTYVPPGVDLKANNLRIIYHFHGTYSQNVLKDDPQNKKGTVGWNRLQQTIEATDRLAKTGENIILVYPLSQGPRIKPNTKNPDNKKYDALWMATEQKDSEGNKVTDNFDRMHQEVIQQVGIKPEQISKIEAQGHSAAGLTLGNIARSGTNLVNTYRFLDASYRGWAEACYSASRENGKPQIDLIISNTNNPERYSSPQKVFKASKWKNKWTPEMDAGTIHHLSLEEGMDAYVTNIRHANISGKFTGWTPDQKLS